MSTKFTHKRCPWISFDWYGKLLFDCTCSRCGCFEEKSKNSFDFVDVHHDCLEYLDEFMVQREGCFNAER